MKNTSTCRPLRRRISHRLAAVAALVLAVAGLAIVTTTAATAAIDPCGPSGNKISCENSKPGTSPSVWDVDGAGSSEIQGFATSMSVNVGQRVDFKIDTAASAYTVQIFRSGYYDGLGARKIADVTPSATLPQQQPNCITNVETDLTDCGNWAVSASWNVPSTAVSGVYFALLHVVATGAESHVMFVVRDDASTSDVVVQTSDTTWQAYNTYGGASFYVGGGRGRALELSYNRPIATRSWENGRDFYFSAEYPLVRFLERNGYDVSYLSGLDTQRTPNPLLQHKTFISVGHDEYWTGQQRANVEQARDAGVNLMFLSGNEMYWRSRWAPSQDGSNTPNRTLVTYKETWDNKKSDPSQSEWTGTWRDPRFAPKSTGAGRPENAVTGTLYMSNFSDLAMQVPAAQGKYRLWRNTSVATLSAGATATLAPHTVGYESDEDLDNGNRPGGLIRMSTTTGSVPEYLQDFGNTTAPGTTTHHMTMYRASSGALVFSAGTVQWTWGLDSEHDSVYAAEPADARMQQAQVNLLADMSAQPTTLQTGLVAAARSTDTVAPTATISSPAAGSNQSNGASVTVTGTASDSGGGVVAGVEVSLDEGATWHAANGTNAWSYTYLQSGLAGTAVRVRAMDDSGNIGATVSRTVQVTCPCSVFGALTPPILATDESGSFELGLRFTPTNDGFVTGVRFYKGVGNTGTHVGSLWSSSGARLGSVTFTNESATGWQSATFSSPVAVTAGSTYIVSYTAPSGHYALRPYAFSAGGVDAAPLTVEGGFGATPAGVFANAGQFPSNSFRNSNYFVDALFTTTDDSPLSAINQWPLPGSSSVPSTTTVNAKFSKPIDASSLAVSVKDANNATVAGTKSYDAATRTVTFTPSAPLAGFVNHTVTLSAADAQGNAVSTGKTWSFTTARPPSAPGVCPCSLFDDTLVPTVLDSADPDQVTLGLKFTPTVTGTVTGVRFYKGATNTGAHIGTLWTSTGTKLAEGTFSNESTAGWQSLTFGQPIAVTKNTTYVVSYLAQAGHYSLTPNAFAESDLSKVPLTVSSASGAYVYGTGFPSNSTSTSYLVDVIFEKGVPVVSVTSQDPAPGATDVPRRTPITVGFSAAVNPTYTMTVKVGSTTIAGTSGLSADQTALTFTPSSLLPADADVTVSLAGVTSVDGASLPTQNWTFHTRSPDTTAHQTMFGDLVPETTASDDAAPVELGTAFTAARDGTVTAIRFFKGTGNLGTHVGSLWSATGTKLASVTFTGESANGWQQATLATPVAISAGTTYVVSYLAPQGHYSFTPGFFSSASTAGDLTAPATNNGRYLYGAAGGFPTFSWNGANYFVDVVFQRTVPPLTIADRSPAPGASDVPRSAQPSIRLSAPLAAGWGMVIKQGTTTLPGTATLSGDGQTITFTPTSLLPADADLTVTVTGLASTDGASLSDQSWTFQTESGTSSLASLLADQVPTSPSVSDGEPLELGMAFTPSTSGNVTGIRFYKGAGNTGVHTGSIWSTTGTRLATVTFNNETASGWQTADLQNPLALTAGQTYIVSYYSPTGAFALTPGYFTGPLTAEPLTAPAANGRYVYGSGGGFPSQTSGGGHNYWVDVVYRYQTG